MIQRSLKWLYKYSMLICYTLLFLTFYFVDKQLYADVELHLSNVFGASLLFCFSEYYTAILLRKCKWQKGCIIGIGTYCIVNLIFIDNFNDFYYSIAQNLSFISGWTVIFYFLYVEEVKLIKVNK